MAITAANYSLRTAVNTQEVVPSPTITGIPTGNSFYGTLTVLNTNALNATIEVWFVPNGVGTPRDQDYVEKTIIAEGKPLTISALSLPAGTKVFVRSTLAVTVNLNGQLSS